MIALITAYGFSRHRNFRGRQLLLILVICTQLFPFVILITPLYAMFFSLGLINSFAEPDSLLHRHQPAFRDLPASRLSRHHPQDLDEAAKHRRRLDAADHLQGHFAGRLAGRRDGRRLRLRDGVGRISVRPDADDIGRKQDRAGRACRLLRRIHHAMEPGDDGIGDFDAAHACPFHVPAEESWSPTSRPDRSSM